VSTYYVENFGCRATQADGAALERQFQQSGLSPAPTAAHASIVVMNTCTVTASADQDARAAIRRVRRHNPNAQIVITGCYAQRAPAEVAALPGVSLVIGNSHKHRLAEIVRNQISERRPPAEDPCFVPLTRVAGVGNSLHPISHHPSEPGQKASLHSPTFEVSGLTSQVQPFVSDIFAHTELLAAPVFDAANERTRPNLKVQDGCDNRCSFCVIPYVRGQSRSLPLDRILGEVNHLVASGYREVVISGINLGRWGRDLPGFRLPPAGFGTSLADPDQSFRNAKAGSQKPTFESLIHGILSHTALEKLRISSVEPMDWTDDLISLIASSPRIARHAHVPMQSASDAVLRRMHRKYRPWHYRQKIEKIRAALPTAAIGADVMVGFPGETDAEFEATRRMIEDLPFTYLHVFSYSARPGTPAAAMPNQVPVQVSRERNKILRELAAEKKSAFMRRFVGEQIEAITLHSRGESPYGPGAPVHESCDQTLEPVTEALTDNYLKLRLRGRLQPNRWITAEIEGIIGENFVGSVSGLS